MEITVAIAKLITIPIVPMPSGEMPNNQFASTLAALSMNLK